MINFGDTHRLCFVGLNGAGDVLEHALNLLAFCFHLVDRLIRCCGNTHHSRSDVNDSEYRLVCAKSLEKSADL